MYHFEKKYKEAEERAKKALLKCRSLSEGQKQAVVYALKKVFPNLEESNDERIRKEMIAWLQSFFGRKVSVVYTENEIRERIAYLDRQDPEHIGKIARDSKQEGINSVLDNPKQYGLLKAAEPPYVANEQDAYCFNQLYYAVQRSDLDEDVKEYTLDFLRREYKKTDWKPSEEQMKALESAIDYLVIHTSTPGNVLLQSLCEDLKKL